ncbi:MAG: ABC transporter ATP-binding protein [Deltaproteobacteria bacterium]|nr:ABC transporter ATP-binding protein [Deltaproteobacteria bacterium]
MTIETDQVCFGYGRQPAISDVSLKLNSGVFYGILGPNGCGKTTLVDLLIRHRTPDAGIIFYQGKPLAKYSRKQIARRFALVPQQYSVNFPFTSRQVVMMGRYPHLGRFAFPELILDEATSNLDISHAISLFSLAHKRVINEGKTVIAVMQDINLAALFCQYLILMKSGRVVSHGPCDQVLTETTIQSVFQVKAKVYEDTYANARQVVFNRSSHVP